METVLLMTLGGFVVWFWMGSGIVLGAYWMLAYDVKFDITETQNENAGLKAEVEKLKRQLVLWEDQNEELQDEIDFLNGEFDDDDDEAPDDFGSDDDDDDQDCDLCNGKAELCFPSQCPLGAEGVGGEPSGFGVKSVEDCEVVEKPLPPLFKIPYPEKK